MAKLASVPRRDTPSAVPTESNASDVLELFPNKATPDDLQEIQRQGFKILGESYKVETKSQYYFLESIKTGTKVVLVQNDDPHLRFDIRFITLPMDSTGVFHKLEHGVISESGLIPVADVFDECARSLLLTNVNASTASDKTAYYASGTDEYSVKEMAKVFTHAVLKGRPSKHTYLREHGHLKIDDTSDCGFRFGGVVHDEMIAAYSGIRYWVDGRKVAHLFPGSPFSHSAGGNPAFMSDLTLEEYQRTYDENYAASKAFIGLYGNISLSNKLEFINSLLDGHQRGESAPAYPEAIKFNSSIDEEATFPAELGGNIPSDRQHRLSINWKFDPIEDYQTTFELNVLTTLLTSVEFSPFTQAYRQTGIQNVHQYTSLDRFGNEMVLEMEFANSTKDDLFKTKLAVDGLLNHFAREGFARETIEAILNVIELKEDKKNRSVQINNEFVNSLELSEALEQAMYGKYEIDTVSMRARAAALRRKLDAGEPIFENLLRKFLVENQNRLNLTLVPDQELRTQWTAAQKEKISKQVSAMTDGERGLAKETARKMEEEERALEEGQDLSKAPLAKLDERYRHHHPVAHDSIGYNGARIIYHNQDLNNQVKLQYLFDISHIPPEELPMVQFLSIIMTELGPEGRVPGQFANEMMQVSTGLGSSTATVSQYGIDPKSAESGKTFLSFTSTFEAERCGEVLELTEQALRSPQLDHFSFMAHFADRLNEETVYSLNNARQFIGYLQTRLAQAMSAAGESMQAQMPEAAVIALAKIQDRLANDPAGLATDLKSLHERIFCKENLTMHVVASEHFWPGIELLVKDCLDKYTGSQAVGELWTFTQQLNAKGFETEGNNNYVGLRTQLRDEAGHVLANDGPAIVACAIMDRFLSREVRRIGGAYGGTVYFEWKSGQLYFISWRDPHIARTLEIYHAAADFLLKNASNDLVERAKVTVLGQFELPESNEDKANRHMHDLLTGLTPDIEDGLRCAIMDTTPEQIHEFARRLKEALARETAVRVYGGRHALEQANKQGVGLEICSRTSP